MSDPVMWLAIAEQLELRLSAYGRLPGGTLPVPVDTVRECIVALRAAPAGILVPPGVPPDECAACQRTYRAIAQLEKGSEVEHG